MRKRLLMDAGPLRVPEFRRLWWAGGITAVGAALTAVAVPLQVYALTRSSVYLGLAGAAGFVPMAVAALLGGAIADAADRRRVLLVTNGGTAVTSLLLWAQAVMQLRSVWVLLALVAVQQGLFGANAATSGAIIPRLVPAGLLPAANSLQSMVVGMASIAGPLLAGSLMPVVGTRTLYLTDAVAMCVTLWAVCRLPPLQPLPPPLNGGIAIASGIAEGLRVLNGSRVLLVAYLADFSALFLGLPYALYPQLAQQVFGARSIGVLYAAMPTGTVLAGLVSGIFTRTQRYGVAVTVAVCAWGLALAGFGAARSIAAASGLLVLAGAALLVLSTFRKAILQTVASDELRGRLAGMDTVVGQGGPRLAGLTHGWAATAAGPAWAVSGGGLLTVAVMVILAAAFPAFWRYRGQLARSPGADHDPFSRAPASPASAP